MGTVWNELNAMVPLIFMGQLLSIPKFFVDSKNSSMFPTRVGLFVISLIDLFQWSSGKLVKI